MEALKRQNLQAEMDYLKYQINPHFFMNTLNNIHALIDIDTESAKNAVIEPFEDDALRALRVGARDHFA